MKVITTSVVLLASFGLLAGCGDYSNPQLKEDLEFLAAIPAKETLDLRVANPVPRSDSNWVEGEGALTSRQDAVLGQLAEFYASTLVTTRGINGGVLGFLELVDWITHRIPPTKRELNRRIWGPWPSDDDPGVDVRFEMRRYPLYQTDPKQDHPFSFHFQMRPEEAADSMGYDEGWEDCVSGSVDPKGLFRRGEGTMLIDLTTCSSVTGKSESGEARVTFDTAPDGDNPLGKTQLGIEFIAFYTQDAIDKGEGPLTADYSFFEASDTSGLFDFTTWADIHAESDPQLDAEEIFEWRIRWADDGCGRADARIYGGDLGAFEIEAIECWDTDHRRVYYSFPFAEPPDQPIEGDPADCCLPSAYD